MRSGRGRRRLALACTAAAMVLTGCGAASDEKDERSESERARAALLRQADLPAEWARVDPGSDASELTEETISQICPDYPAEWLRTDGEATASFESANGVVTHGVTIVDSEDTAKQFDDFGSERSQRCLRRALEYGMREAQSSEIRLEAGEVETTMLDLPGDERAMRVELTLTAPDQGVEVPVVGDFVIERSGSAFSTLATMAVGQPADDALRDRLAEVAAQRLKQNFG